MMISPDKMLNATKTFHALVAAVPFVANTASCLCRRSNFKLFLDLFVSTVQEMEDMNIDLD